MIVFSSVLRRAVYPAMSATGFLSRYPRPGGVSVLTYHGIRSEDGAAGSSPVDSALITPSQFRQQLRFLKSRYEIITPADFRAWIDGTDLPSRALLLTCDDGLSSVLSEMVPVLRQESVQCLFFVTGQSLHNSPGRLWYEELYSMLNEAPGSIMLRAPGGVVRKDSLPARQLVAYWWKLAEGLSAMKWEDRAAAMERLRDEWMLTSTEAETGSERGRPQPLMNRTDLQSLIDTGMTVGAHSMTHPVLAQMPEELAELEICECRLKLEAALGREVWALAYPFGSEGTAGAREMKMAADAGYSCAFMNCGGGRLDHSTPRFALPRAHVTSEMRTAELEAHLSGFHERLQKRFRRRERKEDMVRSSVCA